MYWIDGDKYEKEKKNDLKDGKGIIYQIDGGRYESDYKNGLYEGKGIYYYKDEEIKKGN